MNKLFKVVTLLLLPITAVFLIALQMKPFGWYIFLAGVVALFFCDKSLRKDIILVYISLALLGVTPITTDISITHMLQMGGLLTLAIAIPYVISRYLYRDHLVRFKMHHGRKWTKKEIGYIFLTFIIAYLLFPFMLRETGSYLNWTVELGAINLFILFLGTNALGIWDELFFVNTVLGILRKHLSFLIANLIQSIMFTAFLYELGFRGWIFIIIFFFALLQGYVFKKTESLLYVIAIHLTADLILYLVLIHLHHPQLLQFFLT